MLQYTYTSPFKDIYGSKIIFAGPHRSFTKANRGARTHAVYSLRRELECIHDPDNGDVEKISQRVFPITTDKELGLTAHPHPLLQEDVEELGVEVPVQFEDMTDVVFSTPGNAAPTINTFCRVLVLQVLLCVAGRNYIFMLYVFLTACHIAGISNKKFLYFRGMRTKTLEEWARTRMIRKRRNHASEADRMLVPRDSTTYWGKGRAYDQYDIVKAINGTRTRHVPGKGNDTSCMRDFLSRLDPASLQNPGIGSWLNFIPGNSPFIDYLAVHVEYSSDGWLYPSLSILKELQDSKAISYSMLDKCEIREIIVGESSEFEVKQFVDWTITMHDRDDVSLPCSGLSLTIQTVDISLRDIYRIAGLIPLDAPRKILSCELETDQRDDCPEDTWKKLPTKILIGNGVTWAAGSPWLSTVQVKDGIRKIKKDLMITEDVYWI